MIETSKINHLISDILAEECEKEANSDIEEIIQRILHRAIEYSDSDKIPVKDCDKIFQEYIQ